MYVVIAIHYPKPEHTEDFLAFMAKAETVAHGSPGMLRFGSWREDGGKRLVGLSMWARQVLASGIICTGRKGSPASDSLNAGGRRGSMAWPHVRHRVEDYSKW